MFTKTCNFDVTKKHLSDKALKAIYEVLKMGRFYKLRLSNTFIFWTGNGLEHIYLYYTLLIPTRL